jgi:NAD(P) transhydrogenase subunit alpha
LRITVPKEQKAGEARVPILPADVKTLVELGAEFTVESGLGASVYIGDDEYKKAGAAISSDHAALLRETDLILRLNTPTEEDVSVLGEGVVHISYLDPFNNQELIAKLKAGKISALSMEMIPRTTLAQKMDALSSQASLAGYTAVVLAASHLQKVFPMMMTPAGTLAPTKVFIIGAGVAGLQAIATAKRLGARVEAFDTRPVVEEQVLSLGAKFVKIDLGDTGQTKDGYAKELTPEQLEMQRQGMAKKCAQADVVITTAQVFGRKAPVIVTADMLAGMQPGSVIVDMAVETGGNVEGAKAGEVVEVNGVKIVGLRNLPGMTALHASQMYSSNLKNLLTHFWDKEKKEFVLNREDEIMAGSLITHAGEIVNSVIKERLEA